MKRGISLIVLVITIIIIIILAGAVILNLANNNPIDSAEKSKIMSDLDSFSSDLTIQIGQKYLTDYSLKTEDIDSDETRDEWHLVDLVPSVKGSEYEEYLTVENGKLRLRIDAELDKAIKEIIEEKLGKAVLTKEMILKEPEKYIGMQVKYEGYTETTNTIEWRLFGLDAQGNLMLKANDYVNLSYKNLDGSKVIFENNSNYCIKGIDSRDNLIKYFSTSNNWNEYAVSGKTIARGTMTLPEFIEGYNLVNSEKIEVEYLNKDASSKDNLVTAVDAGYVLKKGTSWNFYASGINQKTSNGMIYYYDIDNNRNINHMWLASNSAASKRAVMRVCKNQNNTGSIGRVFYDEDTLGGICPVISLTTASLIMNESEQFEVE